MDMSLNLLSFAASILMFGGVPCSGVTPPMEEDVRLLPEPYPISFSVSFATNITSASSSTNHSRLRGTGEASTKRQLSNHDKTGNGTAVYGKLYYDFGVPAQRIDHGPGSYECLEFYNHSLTCSLIFLEDGMYRILHDDYYYDATDLGLEGVSENRNPLDCCLDLVDIRPPPPEWASEANPTYDGIFLDEYSQLLAHQWTFDKIWLDKNQRSNLDDESKRNNQYHTKRQVVSGDYAGRSLLFTFPSAMGRQDMHYRVDTLKIAKQSSEIFKIPDECIARSCGN